ncbi:probable dolichyl pyrophosphate Glc1Man9GlcNAc2 alpha-1,3-glucosyltransferase [Spinacia oleracea]|uniref:Alpha-1,3-glucosyltransferase n=1 Tax=Spinacia oleracea TaxID=3562 RepID=A0ABM3R134_SPIOL|nr:probable dolichyl pyrophosphate Glc1Man9GlcNAc2 alpha-1,3-glucosyltransferase [Spinacia oleracea]
MVADLILHYAIYRTTRNLDSTKRRLILFFFAVLLCCKHLFAVVAPVYFVYLLRHYCRGGLFKGFGRLLLMGMAVVVVFVAAFWPFVYHDQVFKTLREEPFTKEELDEVRDKWATYFNDRELPSV